MFDSANFDHRDELLDSVHCFFFDHGHHLAQAAALLGRAAAEARVVSCALRLEAATRVDRCIQSDLVAFHQLLALHDVGDPECLETALFANLHPASAEVETICLLTEQLDDLLHDIGCEPDCGRVFDDIDVFAA
ncbi:hypothetical protein RM543_10425 [Roseicyclus sp. F158]|uniref:Uncharacterized protein n=1 Tax=Tropicimonas omnivorans TaxID=3075590 RepID=A0ABU3DHE6_9RHOB|nr:hypothetical protein [Roseicyclus sp. F158]MDT0683102.1 hypothetical protein [Roseicyclus sp. F158]